MPVLIFIALKHLMARQRQSLVSLAGIVLGVGFFLSISSMMQGSETDFLKRLVDNAPHVTVSDDFREARVQPAELAYPGGAVAISNVRPQTETRGIRGYARIMEAVRAMPGVRAAAILSGQAIVSFAGRDVGVGLTGIVPREYAEVSALASYMKQGALADLDADPNGLLVGDQFLKRLSLERGENISLVAPGGQVRNFKIVGVFHTGRADVDERQVFGALKRVQTLLNRPDRVNSIVAKLDDAQSAREAAAEVERIAAYKSVSWQEASQDILNALVLRKIIMYSVVSAVLIVAAFGIYNVISTVAMEKRRDIAILKSMGFCARDIQFIFVVQGLALGLAGSALGVPFGAAIMAAFGSLQFKIPGASDPQYLAMDWGIGQFALAVGFAMMSAMIAAFLPARKAANVQPVEILRGGF